MADNFIKHKLENKLKEQQLIEIAVNLIRLHHGLGMPEKEEERMWNIYFNCSPEMKPFKEYLESHPAENLVIASEHTEGSSANGAVADFYRYGILILDVMKLKFFSNKDDFETARDVLLNNDKRLIYFKKKNGFWTQPEVYQ